jgi:hypothetical protein
MKIITPIIALIILFTAWNIYLVSANDIKYSDIYPQETYTAQINGRDTKIHEYKNHKSFNITYSYCKPLLFIDDCRWEEANYQVFLDK